MLFALAARLPYFVVSDFPLNDGGMFVAMSQDIIDAHYALPTFTSYNFEGIPFAYPPLAFYLVASVANVTGIDPVALARYVPLMANLTTVVAVAVLARSLLGPGWAAVIAPIVFALVPRSYEWMIMGGGLTRSVGLLFAVLCLIQAREVYARPTVLRGVLCAVLAALALTTHLELGLFALYSLVLMALFYGRSVRALLISFLIGVSVIGLTAPWWATVVSRHGLAPFDAASLTGGWSTLKEQLVTLEQFLTPPRLVLGVPATLAVLGAISCALRGKLFVPVWLPCVFIFTPRSAASEATLPFALLAGVGLGELVGPGLVSAVKQEHVPSLVTAAGAYFQGASRRRSAALLGTAASLALLLCAVFLYWPRLHFAKHALDSLSVADRRAMMWVAQNTAETSRFLVLTSTSAWEEDHVSEWFPVLAGRRSLLTPQGSEWLPGELYSRKVCLYNKLRWELSGPGKGTEFLDEWARGRGIGFSHIYVSKLARGPHDWTGLVASAGTSPNYTVVLDDAGATVLQRENPITPRWQASGELMVSRDCWSLADQPEAVQAAFDASHGPFAARAWVEEHHQLNGQVIAGPPGLCRRLGQLGLGRLAC
jgi:hypothetical protein